MAYRLDFAAALYPSAGENPSGNPCEALHYHGYIGMEAQAVAHITQWMQASSNQ